MTWKIFFTDASRIICIKTELCQCNHYFVEFILSIDYKQTSKYYSWPLYEAYDYDEALMRPTFLGPNKFNYKRYKRKHFYHAETCFHLNLCRNNKLYALSYLYLYVYVSIEFRFKAVRTFGLISQTVLVMLRAIRLVQVPQTTPEFWVGTLQCQLVSSYCFF